ncbi:MAG: hypothetical protein AB1938_31415 [Myxococcota bacterium]
MVAPVLIALLVAASPALLPDDAPRDHQGWLLGTTVWPSPLALAPQVADDEGPPRGLLIGGLITLGLGVAVCVGTGIAMVAMGPYGEDSGLAVALIFGPPMLLGIVMILVGLPLSVVGFNRVEDWNDKHRPRTLLQPSGGLTLFTFG